MHEIGIAQELSTIVINAAKKEKLLKVTKVNISFGQMIQIVPDIFEFAFRESVRGTVAGEAAVNIEILTVKMRCKSCQKEFVIEDNLFFCSGCGAADLDILQGKELFVKSIEGEKNDKRQTAHDAGKAKVAL